MKQVVKNSYKLCLIIRFCFALILISCLGNYNLLLAQKVEENKDIAQEKKEEAAKEPETSEKEEKIDPTKDFRLLAVYLISGQSRALIKNLSNQDEPPREFRVGDFLDELETIEVSRISLNPTARVELLDKAGFSYLMRTQAGDLKAPSVLPKFPSGKGSLPSYFSAGKASKHKMEKKEGEKLEKPKDVEKEVAPTTKSDTSVEQEAVKTQEQTTETKQEQAKAQTESQAPSQETSQAIQPATTPQTDSSTTSHTASQTPAPTQPLQQPKSDQDLLSRPVNPF